MTTVYLAILQFFKNLGRALSSHCRLVMEHWQAAALSLVVVTATVLFLYVISPDEYQQKSEIPDLSATSTKEQTIRSDPAASNLHEAKTATAPDLNRRGTPDATRQKQSVWMTIALAVMALAMAISVAVTFYLYRWRRILLSNPHMMVHEELGGYLNHLATSIDRVTSDLDSHVGIINKNLGTIHNQGSEVHGGVANLIETFMTLQKALDERDAEIRRLKAGYDAEVFRKFVKRFIRVDQAIADFQRDAPDASNSLDQLQRLLEDAFAECGVESFSPKLGDDYRSAEGVADEPKTVETQDPADEFKIVEVLDSGYRIQGPEGYDVIQEARVSIYSSNT